MAALIDLPPRDQIGVIVVDHGSRRRESNDMLLKVVALFQQHSGYAIVEPAHMELAEPSVAAAFDRCIHRGARLIVIHPYFLLPGRHWKRDIPALAAAAAQKHPGIPFLVTAPLGLHPLMAEVMSQRIEYCLSRLRGDAGPCEVCSERETCRLSQVGRSRRTWLYRLGSVPTRPGAVSS